MNETTRRALIPKTGATEVVRSASYIGGVVIAAGIAVQQGLVASGSRVQFAEAEIARNAEDIQDLKTATGKIIATQDDVEERLDGIAIEQARQGQKLDDQSDTIKEIRDILREQR